MGMWARALPSPYSAPSHPYNCTNIIIIIITITTTTTTTIIITTIITTTTTTIIIIITTTTTITTISSPSSPSSSSSPPLPPPPSPSFHLNRFGFDEKCLDKKVSILLVIRRDSYHFTGGADDEYTNLLSLCFLLFLFIYSSLSISFSFLHHPSLYIRLPNLSLQKLMPITMH